MTSSPVGAWTREWTCKGIWLHDEAWSLARTLATGPTRSLGEIKRLVLSSYEQPLEAQLELEARAMARSARTEDGWLGLTSVANKQEPAFVGR